MDTKEKTVAFEAMLQDLEMLKNMGVMYIPKSWVDHKPEGDAEPCNAGALLDTLKAKELKDCRLCMLSKTRNRIVFGEGNPNSTLMFVGEAPGRDEDLAGRPFVGKAGELLTKIIASIGLKREEVYIANVLKCRPPNNRDPEDDEIRNCKKFLQRQIEIIRPKIICALGRFAAKTLLDSERGIMQLRGKFYDVGGIKVMPTFHPSFLLRNPDMKRPVWEDMKLIKLEYDKLIKSK